MYFSNEDFIAELDSFFEKEDLPGAGDCLLRWKGIAERGNNTGAEITVLNEMVGFYRQTGEKEKGLSAVNELIDLIGKYRSLEPSAKATLLLNCATTMKAFGESEKALEIYSESEKFIALVNEPSDSFISAFCNNKALCLQDLKRYDESEKLFLKALVLTGKSKETALEEAVTLVNLSHLYYEMDNMDERPSSLMQKALTILKDEDNFSKPKYAFTCRKCAPSFGFFGFFFDEKYLNERADKAYGHN